MSIGLDGSEADFEFEDGNCGSRQGSKAGFVTASGVLIALRCGVSKPLSLGKVPSVSSWSAVARLVALPNLGLRATESGIRGLLLLGEFRRGGDLNPSNVAEAPRKMFVICTPWLGLAAERERLGKCLLFRALLDIGR